MNILQAIDDPNLFKPWFKNASWAGWRAWLAALFGLPMTAEQLELFHECTGRSAAPTTPAREGWLVCGRRAGKSFILALIAVYLATFRDYTKHLAPGERGTLLILAADRKQSRVIFRYISALLKQVPMLAPLVENERAEFLRPHQPHHDRGWHGVISHDLRLHVCRCSLRRAGLLAIRRQCLTRLRSHQRHQTGHGDYPECHAAVWLVAVCEAWGALRHASETSRQGWSGAGLAGCHAHHEPDRAAELHR